MRKVTTINLNNNAYQIDEDGYDALRAYLDNAARTLAGNPDREEILADLEQAIADKCRLTLGPHKTVVTAAEIERILKEMGPVAGSDDSAAATAGAGNGAATGATGGTAGPASASPPPQPRRWYRIQEGQMWAGVCKGLAAYTGADVSWVRLAVVLLAIFTAFFPCLIIYIALVFILPVAHTSEEIAAAHGQPFNAQELIERVKKKHETFRDEHRARRHMRREAHWWSAPPAAQPAPGYAARVTGGVMLPVLTVLSAVWFAAMAIAAFMVWWGYRYGGLGGWPAGVFPDGRYVPFWMAMAAVVAIYALLAIPIGAGRRAAKYYANGGRLHGWADAWSGFLWLALVAVILLAAWYGMPELQDLMREITRGHNGYVFSVGNLLDSWQQWLAMSWPVELDVTNGNDLVAALPPGSAHLHGIALALAYQGSRNR
jgi:phage shock protein PspC (stress-responsive transcriptional regulator)